MQTTLFVIGLLGILARPAFAHPGHGLPGWLHHGELAIVGSLVIVAVLLRAWWHARQR